ncbi:MAG: portal protein, partial [Caldilineaceae bacterium]
QNMASMRVEHVARMMAPGFEALFSAVQEIIQKHHNKGVTVKLRGGQWVTVDPQAWRTKRDLRISVGVGAGNKDSMLAQLQMQMGAQIQLAQFGIAGPQEVYETAMEISKLQGYANPQKFWKNPSQQQPQPPQPSPDQIKAQTQVQIKQMELQADAQKFQAEWQMKMQQIQAENERKIAELRAQLEVQAQNDQRDAERETGKAVIQAQIEGQKLEYQRQADDMRAQLDKYKADLDAQVKLAIAEKSAAPAIDIGPSQQSLQELLDQMNAPAEIVRGPDGRAVGIKKGAVVRQIQRGPDGRAIGVQ